MLQVIFHTEFIEPINSIICHTVFQDIMAWTLCRVGSLTSKKKKAASKEPFISVKMMLCPTVIGYLSEELGKSPAQSSVLCLVCASVYFWEFVTWMVSWTTGGWLLLGEAHVQQLFLTHPSSLIVVLLCCWFFNIGEVFIMHWPRWACWEGGCALRSLF